MLRRTCLLAVVFLAACAGPVPPLPPAATPTPGSISVIGIDDSGHVAPEHDERPHHGRADGHPEILLGEFSGGWRLATFCAVALFGIAAMDNWDLAMDTLSQVLVAVTISVCLAIPIGIWCGRSKWLETLLRPLLDTAQVLPQFVYLVPVVFLFNVGRVPGVIAAVVYALPPGIRLVSLGLKEVSFAPREAAISFGATPRQELFKVQLPLAFKSIMLGINQVILMVLATVIIAGIIGGGALGLEALGGFTKPNLKMGDGVAAGVSIVLLAMILDRLTQAWGNRSAPENRTS